jgi:C-terminal processing protease CtpA/Prc
MAGFHAKKILNDSLKRIKVYNVIEGSPAHLAGLIKGDIITHIDGVAISQLSEKERKQIFTQESIPVVLHFERNGEKHKASILPHRII